MLISLEMGIVNNVICYYWRPYMRVETANMIFIVLLLDSIMPTLDYLFA